MMYEPAYDPADHVDPTAELRILLCHFPDALPRLRSGRAQLMLSGHLHGGQICLPWPGGRVGLAHPRSGPVTAVEACNGTVMHTSPGLGTTFVPLRLLAPSRGHASEAARRLRRSARGSPRRSQQAVS